MAYNDWFNARETLTDAVRRIEAENPLLALRHDLQRRREAQHYWDERFLGDAMQHRPWPGSALDLTCLLDEATDGDLPCEALLAIFDILKRHIR